MRGISLSIYEGDFVLILGSSGGGKSSLLNIIGTIDTPSRGMLKLFGKILRGSTQDSEYALIRQEKIGFVFQSFNLVGSMSALENVELPMLLKGVLSRKESRERAKKLLCDLGLGNRFYHYPNMLSGGEQQRVTIARALANEPELLLMDEPTGDLDTKNTDNIMNLLLELNQKKKITMIMVTHDEYMKQFATRIFNISDGKVNKLQIVDKGVRQRAIEKLSKTVEMHKSGNDSIGVRMGVTGGNSNSDDFTETRSVMDYPFIKHLVNRVKPSS